MKKILLLGLLTFIGMFATAQKHTRALPGELRKGFVEVGAAYCLISPDKGDNMDFFGFAGSVGFYVTRKSRLSLDIGALMHSGKQIGTFSYTKTYGDGRVETFYDGEISRDFVAFPVLASWTYEFDLTDRFHLRVGPSIGVTSLSASNKYSPDVEGTPGSMEDNAEVFSYGGTLGFAWDVGKRATINLGYRFIGNEKATIDNSELKTTAHQIYITYGWRFLKK